MQWRVIQHGILGSQVGESATRAVVQVGECAPVDAGLPARRCRDQQLLTSLPAQAVVICNIKKNSLGTGDRRKIT